jgi:hypothetical protein
VVEVDPGEHQPADPPAERQDEEVGKRVHRWLRWRRLRTVLLVAEGGLVLMKHEALAGLARALVMVGDAVFSSDG